MVLLYGRFWTCSSGSCSRTKRKVGKLYYQPYSPEQKNILVVGPVAGNDITKWLFLSFPDPSTNKDYYLKNTQFI
jgi:hypothetical protein